MRVLGTRHPSSSYHPLASLRHPLTLLRHPSVTSSCPSALGHWSCVGVVARVVGRVKNLPEAQMMSDIIWALWFVVTTITIPKIQKNKVTGNKWNFF